MPVPIRSDCGAALVRSSAGRPQFEANPARMDHPTQATIVDLIATRESRDPTLTTLIFPDEHAELTNADVRNRADACASMFSYGGLARGNKLAIMMANGSRYATCLFGAWRLAAIAVPVDPMLKGPDARDLINASGAVALAIDERRLMELSGLFDECETLQTIFTVGAAPMGPRFCDFDATLTAAVEARKKGGNDYPRPQDIAIESYRFHTDSFEAVPRAHDELSRNAMQLADRLALTKEDRGISYIPLGHSDGATALVAAIASGSKLVLPERFDARRFWELVAAQRATWLALMPTQFLDLTYGGPPASGSHKGLRVITVAGKVVTAEAKSEFAESFGIGVV
jgi:acyl-CoA synthetase (AMP-forming)/AMP-acid ligase II